MIGSLNLILCVSVYVTVLNTAECQVTVRNLNDTGNFLCGYSTRLECAITNYGGGMVWKLDGTIIAQCAFTSCTALGALPSGDKFTADESAGKFNLDIGITHADNGTAYQCDDGSNQDQTTVNIQVPPSESAFATNITETTASITVEAGCFYPSNAGRMDVICDNDGKVVQTAITMTPTTTGCTGDCAGPNIYTAVGSYKIDNSTTGGNSRYRFIVYHEGFKQNAVTYYSSANYDCVPTTTTTACVCDCKIAFPCVVIVFAVLVFILEIAFCCLNKDGAFCCLNKDGACCCLNKDGACCCSDEDGACCCLNKDGACCCLNKDGACCCLNKDGAFCCLNKDGAFCCSNKGGAFCCLNKDGTFCNLNKDGACCCSNKCGASCCSNEGGACCCSNEGGASCCSNEGGAFCCLNKGPFSDKIRCYIAGIAVVICLGLVIGVTVYLFVGCDKCKSECCKETCPIAFTVSVWILLVCDAVCYIIYLVKYKQLEGLSCVFCQVEPSCETKHASEPQHSNQPGEDKFARNGNNDKGRENASRTNAGPRPQPAPPTKDSSPLPGITKDKASRGLSATFDDQFDHMPSFESKNKKLQPLPNSITEEDEQKKKKKKKKRKNDETM